MQEISWEIALSTCLEELVSDRQFLPRTETNLTEAHHLVESMRYSFLAPGKRIRPRLLEASASLFSLPEKAVTWAGVAIEMVHCFTLIHDDMPCLDNDDFRRGRPSNHRKFNEATALLAGDALFSHAFSALSKTQDQCDPSGVVRAISRLAQAVGTRGVIGGQMLEFDLKAFPNLPLLEQVHQMKTSALFEATLLIPLDLAAVKSLAPEKTQSLEKFSRAIGMSFQALDDLEDPPEEAKSEKNLLKYRSRGDVQSSFVALLQSSRLELQEAWGIALDHRLLQISLDLQNRFR